MARGDHAVPWRRGDVMDQPFFPDGYSDRDAIAALQRRAEKAEAEVAQLRELLDLSIQTNQTLMAVVQLEQGATNRKARQK